MIIVSIDGASRRNGKPDCLAVGSVFVKDDKEGFSISNIAEYNSTSQRGEINAITLALAMDFQEDEAYLITDSDYVFSTISKEWYKSWERKGWITAEGNPVKNRDLWEIVSKELGITGTTFLPYLVKGHLLSFGKVTAAGVLQRDPSGETLYKMMLNKTEELWQPAKLDILNDAMQRFSNHNGVMPSYDVFKEMIACNMVADLAAGYFADITDAAWHRN